jgi:hypothetical protein
MERGYQASFGKSRAGSSGSESDRSDFSTTSSAISSRSPAKQYRRPVAKSYDQRGRSEGSRSARSTQRSGARQENDTYDDLAEAFNSAGESYDVSRVDV